MKLIFWLWAAALLACLVAMAFLVSAPSNAQSISASFCGEYAEFIAAIKGQYHEESLGKGFTRGGAQIVELFASKETFTILVTDQSGRTCMITAGKNWVAEPTKIQGDDL